MSSSVDYNGVNDRLTLKIMNMLKNEVTKSDTQQKIKCVVDPLIKHISGIIQPLVTSILVIICLTLIGQIYLIHRIWALQKSLTK